jgi:DNA-directed RNA polymerase specialized sigma24 family protein
MDLDVFLPLIIERNTKAFGQWMARAEGPLRDSLHSFVTVVDVESVLQETLVRVWRVAPRFVPDGRPNGLFRLGRRIARNLAISEVRKRRARLADEEEMARDVEGESVSFDEPDPMLREVIARCHERLPEQPRRVLDVRLGAAGGQGDEILAEGLHMRLNTFLQNFGRARKLLADCLKKAGIVLGSELGT